MFISKGEVIARDDLFHPTRKLELGKLTGLRGLIVRSPYVFMSSVNVFVKSAYPDYLVMSWTNL